MYSLSNQQASSRPSSETFSTHCRPAPEPVYRPFDNEKPTAKDRMDVLKTPDNYRIVSIGKLLDSPPKATD